MFFMQIKYKEIEYFKDRLCLQSFKGLKGKSFSFNGFSDLAQREKKAKQAKLTHEEIEMFEAYFSQFPVFSFLSLKDEKLFANQVSELWITLKLENFKDATEFVN